MGDAMVTARMPQAKRDAGNRVLGQLGCGASRFINSAYGYLIQHGESPFEVRNSADASAAPTAERIAEALAQVEGMCLPPSNRFAAMTDHDVRRERLERQGFEG